MDHRRRAASHNEPVPTPTPPMAMAHAVCLSEPTGMNELCQLNWHYVVSWLWWEVKIVLDKLRPTARGFGAH